MFLLRLVFVLTTSPLDDLVFEDHTLAFATQAECVAAMQWWIENPQAELPGMDPAFDQLILPVPAWDCQPQLVEGQAEA